MPARKDFSPKVPDPALPASIPPPPTVPGTFDDTLPIGLKTDEGVRVRKFRLHEHTALDVEIIRDVAVLRRSPILYTMRLACIGIESIGDQNVYSVFREREAKTNAKKQTPVKQIPDVIKKLTVSDAEYLLVAAHINSYGPTVTTQATCPHCQAEEEIMFDLSEMGVTKFPLDDDDIDPLVTVELDKGATFGIEAYANLGSVVWKHYTMKMPTMADLLAAEKEAGRNRRNFDMRALSKAVVQVASEQGKIMPNEMKAVLRERIITDLKASDMIKLGRFISESLPRLDRGLQYHCGTCGGEAQERLDPTMLVQLGG